ncbi:MAG TPA: DUF2442 domain-containing protein [Nitrospirales bacterium]|jgi:hypothetical protein|nr:DUF2442 domain-containing protein [Nitrospirales bacterium]
MAAAQIESVNYLGGYRLRLTLTDGSVVERDVTNLMGGPLFSPIVLDPSLFHAARVEDGVVIWPNGAKLGHDDLISPR